MVHKTKCSWVLGYQVGVNHCPSAGASLKWQPPRSQKWNLSDAAGLCLSCLEENLVSEVPSGHWAGKLSHVATLWVLQGTPCAEQCSLWLSGASWACSVCGLRVSLVVAFVSEPELVLSCFWKHSLSRSYLQESLHYSDSSLVFLFQVS